MTIGALAKEAGLRPSAVRYYERLGLLPPPPRKSGRRSYAPEALSQLAVVQFARQCGFTLEETGRLVEGFDNRAGESVRWNRLAEGKIREMDNLIARAREMKVLLRRISGCRCETLQQCGAAIRRRRRAPTSNG